MHDGTISQTVADRVATELAPVAEQLEHARRAGRACTGATRSRCARAIERLVEARIMGVAQLIRADSEALRQLIEERTEVQVETIRETVDWRMAAFAERIDEKLGSIATEVARRRSEAQTVARRRVARRDRGAHERRRRRHRRARRRCSPRARRRVEERLRAHIDDRMTAIARLIRSDNQALASAVREQQPITPSEPLDAELVRQTLRAIKELQAGLAEDVQTTVDANLRSISDQLHQETQSTTESMVKVAEVLGEKIDRLTRAGRRGRRQRHAGRDRSHERRDPGDVGDTPQRLRSHGSAESHGRVAALDRPLGRAVALARDPQARAWPCALPASSERTRPPATISWPIDTGARNCAEIVVTASGVARPRDDAGRHVAHREHAVGDDAVEPGDARATSSRWCNGF